MKEDTKEEAVPPIAFLTSVVVKSEFSSAQNFSLGFGFRRGEIASAWQFK
jgi:hypothetical protein